MGVISGSSQAVRAATVQDVARMAGVSAMTVSRVINTPALVHADTASRVHAAIDATCFVPNMLAGGLKSKRSRLIAAIVPSLASPVFSATVDALTSALANAGYHLMVGQSGYDQEAEDALLRALMGRRPDGFVLVGVDHSLKARMHLKASGVPVVETWDLTPEPVDMLVGFSHVAAGAAVCRYLQGRGRRSLAVITASDERAMRRAHAFAAAARDAGLVAPTVIQVDAPATMGDGRRALQRLLAQNGDVDGLFCSSDMLALGVLVEAVHRNVPVPERISVVGFGDLGFAGDTEPALTSVRVDGHRIGNEAARCIVHRLENPGAVSLRTLDVGFSIVERASA